MNNIYGKFGKIVRTTIATGALILATAINAADKPIEQSEQLTTKQKIAKNIEFLVNNAKENKKGQWRKDEVSRKIQEYSIAYTNFYLCVTLRDGKFYFLSYDGLKPYTSNSLTILDRVEDGAGFDKPEVNGYNETRMGKLVLRITEKSTEEQLDLANQTELSALEWAIKTQVK